MATHRKDGTKPWEIVLWAFAHHINDLEVILTNAPFSQAVWYTLLLQVRIVPDADILFGLMPLQLQALI
jgi:hypothetical protein